MSHPVIGAGVPGASVLPNSATSSDARPQHPVAPLKDRAIKAKQMQDEGLGSKTVKYGAIPPEDDVVVDKESKDALDEDINDPKVAKKYEEEYEDLQSKLRREDAELGLDVDDTEQFDVIMKMKDDKEKLS